MAKKITQNVNKDAGLLDLPKVNPPKSKWKTESSNYLTCNIGDIVPVFVDECLPGQKSKITMGMLSHMTTPIAPIFNAQYTEFRSFFVPYRLAADLLGGYKTRRSPFVKVFGEDPAVSSANIVVPLADQKLPAISGNLKSDFISNLSTFGGIADALDYEIGSSSNLFTSYNFLDMAVYELIYQYKYRNENRESATNSNLYKWLYNLYNRTSSSGVSYDDSFHKANREKDYFTGSQPFTQKSTAPITAGLVGNANVVGASTQHAVGSSGVQFKPAQNVTGNYSLDITADSSSNKAFLGASSGSSYSGTNGIVQTNLVADLSTASGIDINSLRLMIKLQEQLEKDMLYGNSFANYLNARFGTCPMSLIVEEPLELKRVTITSHMQPIFQTSSTSGESTILGTIGANATTQSGEFEIVPETEFKEYGILMICAVHKAQNSYDSLVYKPKRIFKSSRFDFYTPELNDLGYQPVERREFAAGTTAAASLGEAVSYNEAWAEYRYKFNKVHGMFEPSRSNADDYWTLSAATYTDVQSLYKQGTTELDNAISFNSSIKPQFYDAFGFVEIVEKPMSLHSIPGMDGVI